MPSPGTWMERNTSTLYFPHRESVKSQTKLTPKQLSMFSVVNMGHGHPRIVAAATKAMQEGAVVNLGFHSPHYGKMAKRLHEVG